jgi:hypothetical protein
MARMEARNSVNKFRDRKGVDIKTIIRYSRCQALARVPGT